MYQVTLDDLATISERIILGWPMILNMKVNL